MSKRIAVHIARAIGSKQCCRNCLPAAENTTMRTFVTATNPLQEKHIIKVPTMGDSITEGTIVEWVAQIGQAVKEDDVVALVETDKVTVDIKADVEGVIMQQYGAVDDTVEVGADLYEIDTEAEATVTASETPAAEEAAAPAPAAKAATPAPAAAAPAASTTAENSHRTPSINFLGKDGWARVLSGAASAPIVYAIPADYGRPEFTEDEMEALVMGGANIAPDVKVYSAGAEFGY